MTDHATKRETIYLRADGDHEIIVEFDRPAGTPRGGVQILHGMSEHAGRYAEFAARLAGEGYLVARHDHRGHGPHVPSEELGHFADRRGWDAVVADARSVNVQLRERIGDAPVAIFGHSMGSYITQGLLLSDPGCADALVLSGSTHAPRVDVWFGRLAASLIALTKGPRHRSEFLNAQAFGKFNQRFEPARTEFDWLSRDKAAVDAYINDPLCGQVPSAQLWCDLLRGLVQIGRKRNLRRLPPQLPILISGGSDDPVGGRRGMRRLTDRYTATGHDNVDLVIYDGGRHEMLNETNGNAFARDVIDWLSRHLHPPWQD